MDLKAFAKAIIRMSFDNGDLVIEEVHGVMVKHGLLIETTYDSEKHTSEYDEVEDGDPWFEIAPELKD